jgi:hypothetical protein
MTGPQTLSAPPARELGPEPARPRPRPTDQYWDVEQARWAATQPSGLVPAPRRGDQADR